MSNATKGEDPRIGSTVADMYRITRLVGSGGMGSVYEAENVSIGKRVALKFLHVSASEDETTLIRFQREARVISTVQSAHVVQIFDWGQEAGGQPFLVMEYLDGGDLAHRIDGGKIGVGEATRLATEALRGLRKVHAAGIVHRDLKPENLFLVTGDDDLSHVKIVDFGLSKLVEGPELTSADFIQSAKLTQAGAVVGTPLYMSPEQIEGLEEVDQRADLWAMGAILHEMLAGTPPFMDRSYARLVMAICQRDPPWLCELEPAVPPSLARVVQQALQRDRDARFPDADAFIDALQTGGQTLASTGGVVAPAPVAVVHPAMAAQASDATLPAIDPSGSSPDARPVSDSHGGPLDATIAAQTKGAATVWLSDAPVFSLWRGEVEAPDRLRIEARDGTIRDLRLEPVGTLTLGRVKKVGQAVNDLVYPDVASRLAARLHHDGVRWWLERRQECSVPVQVGLQNLERGEKAPLVHGTFVTVGAMRASMVDRRFVSRSVPAGTVDAASGLLARGGLEQEVATALQHEAPHGLVLALVRQNADRTAPVSAAVAIHRRFPTEVIAREADAVALLLRGEASVLEAKAREVAELFDGELYAVGYWALEGEPQTAGSEVELALDALESAAGPTADAAEVVALRDRQQGVRMSIPDDVLERGKNPKQQVLLFGIEEQAALRRIGPKVVGALERELAAIVSTKVGPGALVSRIEPGVITAAVPRKVDATDLGVGVLCDWHARPPVTDGKVELPRSLSWEPVSVERARQRAADLSRECADAHGVLSSLSGGLPYPIAGRVYAAIGASSAVERVKMLFDVLEGTWRFIAIVLAAAYFAKAKEGSEEQLRSFHDRVKTRAGLPLGAWRELARHAAQGFVDEGDPIGQLGRQLLSMKIAGNQTFDALSNLLHSERNNFAHGHYNEARAASDVHAFEGMTRAFLRALRPLAAWTLVTVQRTEPDLFGESQTVEFIDHTGPHAGGARRRIGFTSPVRLANVVYLVRWRDGLVLPLEPWIRRLATDDRFDLYWIDHLPRPGDCNYSAAVSGESFSAPVDHRRLPPALRRLLGTG